MGRNKKEDKKSNIKNKTVKKDIKPIETEKTEEVVVSNEVDTLNVEQEQNVYEENETNAESITQEEIQKSEDSLNVDQEQNDFEEKEQEIINTESIDVAETLEIEETPYVEGKAKEQKSKKNTITTNEMFGYNWMGQVYDY